MGFVLGDRGVNWGRTLNIQWCLYRGYSGSNYAGQFMGLLCRELDYNSSVISITTQAIKHGILGILGPSNICILWPTMISLVL